MSEQLCLLGHSGGQLQEACHAQGLDAAVQEAHPRLAAAHQSVGRLQGAGLACMPPHTNPFFPEIKCCC